MTLLRLVLSAFSALVLTGAMFWFLQSLVSARPDLTVLKTTARIEFTRLRRDTDVQTHREEKPDLQLRPQAPAAAVATTTVATGVAGGPLTATRVGAPGLGARVVAQKISVSGAGSDRDVIPLVRIEPEYPPHAAQRNIEGWVIVRFTITPMGTVKDAMVVDSQPPRVFDEAAARAVSRWKYNPKVQDGVAVERRGVQVLLRFQLEKVEGAP